MVQEASPTPAAGTSSLHLDGHQPVQPIQPTQGLQQPVSENHDQQELGNDHQHSPAYLRSIESNSGAAFARLLTMTLESSDQSVSPMRMLAWNLFLGERQVAMPIQQEALTDILSESEMRHLASIYFDKFHPCYSFIDKDMLLQSISNNWSQQKTHNALEALLSGVGALALLFSNTQDVETESRLASLAKRLLDPSYADPPSLYSATAWVLRTAYLRVTAKPEEAWLASCNALHIIDAAGLMNRTSRSTAFTTSQDPVSIHLRKRVIGVAQHLNIWMSYDLGRSRVSLPNFDNAPPTPEAGEYTVELLDLLPYSQELDPTNELSVDRLVKALVNVLERTHTEPPSVLAQCNVMLCIHRRLHASKLEISENLMAKVLGLIQKSIQAVRSNIVAHLPWHHVANIPFQAVCTLLVIDTAQSFALLSETLACVIAVNEAYPTEATREAAVAACTLLRLHRRRREAEIKKHSDMLGLYPSVDFVLQENHGDPLSSDSLQEFSWFNEFIANSDLASGLDPFILVISTTACMGTLIASFNSAIYNAAAAPSSIDFSVGDKVTALGTSLFVLGFASGPVIWAPGSEMLGRRWPLVLGVFGSCAFTLGSGMAENVQTLIVCRFFAGLFGASPLCVVPAVLADLYNSTYRGVAISLYALTVFGGPFLAPIVGDFIVASHLGWRWTLYLPAILGLANSVFLLLFFKETFAPLVLVQKAQLLRRQTGDWKIYAEQERLKLDVHAVVKKYLTRPLRMLATEPIILLVSMYMSFIYGLVYALLGAYPYVFQHVHGMPVGVRTLPFLGLLLGVVLALIFILGQHRSYCRKLEANNGKTIPEWRLGPAILGAIVFTIGLFWFAWTGFTNAVHWMAPTAAGAFIGFGVLCIFLPCFNYLVDAFLPLAASAVAANIMLRSAVAAGFPLFSTQMFENLGIQWAGMLLACLATIMIPIPIVFRAYGPTLRAKSKLLVEASNEVMSRRKEENNTKRLYVMREMQDFESEEYANEDKMRRWINAPEE
ncbi:hypothetical protein COCMIDRAFT_2731 [Bipolaris oryzae ATCC 44560]|uniref:Major facilitator superfamily (MFS) profile domain-containing protein n=1 Tax=Bipolaris oryzae ATCC 44560 TaxID=930090 RepID=W6ZEN0_COCMI|nr:uncharacterized protein COCMIDRAFT_2731 [Bipolaris oryzae ATCC 44560]EUC48475.1 hypothetical protein COCMIDRAFT_2731 [Bipolaris oryzae ATCC 44560]